MLDLILVYGQIYTLFFLYLRKTLVLALNQSLIYSRSLLTIGKKLEDILIPTDLRC